MNADVSQTWPGNPAPSRRLASPSGIGLRPMFWTFGSMMMPHVVHDVGRIQHSLANCRLMSWAIARAGLGVGLPAGLVEQVVDDRVVQAAEVEGDPAVLGLGAEAVGGEAVPPVVLRVDPQPGVVAPAEGLELGRAEQGVGDQHGLLDRRSA